MDVTEDIQKDVARRIREGFGGFEDNVERIVDYLQDKYPDTDIAPLVRAPGAGGAKAIEDQVSWPEITDCDRLDRAFAALERQGVVARQHFTCCWNCGNVEIRAEVEDAGKKCMLRAISTITTRSQKERRGAGRCTSHTAAQTVRKMAGARWAGQWSRLC